jgi:serralysin
MGNGITGSVVTSTTFTPSSAVPTTHTQSIQNLLSGDKWGGSIGTSVALTYSFTDYSSVFNYTTTGMTELKLMTDTQKTAMVNAMSAWANVANVTFTQVAETATSAGDIRISDTTSFDIPTINEIIAPNTASNGDIWIGANYGGYNDATAGSYTMDAFMHEIGHVLGLDHPSDSLITPVTGEDQLKYSIMSYRAFNGDTTTGDYGNTFFPTTPMLNDIAAIQYLYGANMSYNTGNDTYSWSDGQQIFETIWDAGGNDTIDASNQSSAVTINLNSGQWSTIGGTFWNGQAYVNDCLTIAYGAVIENAKGTSLNDTLIGNQANNVLDGGAGTDTAVFSGNASNYSL